MAQDRAQLLTSVGEVELAVGSYDTFDSFRFGQAGAQLLRGTDGNGFPQADGPLT